MTLKRPSLGISCFFFSLVFCVLFANSSYEMFSDSSLAVIAAAANQLKYLFSFAPLCILMCIVYTLCVCVACMIETLKLCMEKKQYDIQSN